MSLLDGILGQIGGSSQVTQLAERFGLSEEQVQGAVAALGQAHDQPGDTVETAATSTGLSIDTLQGLVSQLGGQEGLSKISAVIDRDGDGNPLNDITAFASKLFGK